MVIVDHDDDKISVAYAKPFWMDLMVAITSLHAAMHKTHYATVVLYGVRQRGIIDER